MIECVVDAGTLLGESPVWSPAEELLYWVDIEGRLIHAYDPTTGLDQSRPTPGRPGSLALTDEPGRLLVAMEHELVWYDWNQDRLTEWVPVEEPETENRLNDGRCDPAGRFWVGSMCEGTAVKTTGLLHRVETDGASAVVKAGLQVSNGLAFSPDGATMYHADTRAETVWVYDYDLDSGEPTNESVYLDFSGLPGRPDGACVDADGCYWVAHIYGWSILRVTPDGAVDREIEVPVEKPTMPAFGGSDLSTLFVTSIGMPGSRPMAEGQTSPGGLFAIDAGVRGLPEPVFGFAGGSVAP